MKEEHDVIVIGSGAGGGACAYGLATMGKKVLLLEAGPRYDPFTDFNLHKNDWEVLGFPDREKGKYTYGKAQQLRGDLGRLRSWKRADGPVNPSSLRKYVGYLNAKGVGGSTLRYQGEAHRLHRKAFRIKTIYGVGRDWPFQYEDLVPFYEVAERILGVAGPRVHPHHKANLPLPPHRLSYAGQIIQKACKKVGIDLIPNSVAILSEDYDGRPSCNYCNACSYGCPRKDKGSVDVTFIPKAESTGNCKIIERAHVFRLNVKRGKAVEAVYYDGQGKEKSVRAKFFVLSCGAVETPRLLLNSGVGNGSGQIGRNMMETLLCLQTAFHPERVDSHRGIPIDGEALDFLFPDEEKLPFASGFRLFSANLPVGPYGFAMNYGKGWGKGLKEDVEKHFGHTITVGGVGEFLPNSDTFVTLDPSGKDSHGVPVARIQAVLGDNELKMLDFMSSRCREILNASGTDDIVEQMTSYDLFMATHVFGTCIMGKDPGDSVVDPFLRSHEVSNLFVADGSVMPSSGGGISPALTISAIGLRVADYIARVSLA